MLPNCVGCNKLITLNKAKNSPLPFFAFEDKYVTHTVTLIVKVSKRRVDSSYSKIKGNGKQGMFADS